MAGEAVDVTRDRSERRVDVGSPSEAPSAITDDERADVLIVLSRNGEGDADE